MHHMVFDSLYQSANGFTILITFGGGSSNSNFIFLAENPYVK